MSPRGQQGMSFGVPPLTRGVKSLGIATLVVSVGGALGETGRALASHLAFTPASLTQLQLWRPFTYTFLSPQPFSLVFSLLALWLLGPALEQRWGPRRFLIFYFASGALAALATFVVALFARS